MSDKLKIEVSNLQEWNNLIEGRIDNTTKIYFLLIALSIIVLLVICLIFQFQ